MNNLALRTAMFAVGAAIVTQAIHAQGRGQQAGAAAAIAPVDLTGYYVSVVTEDWRYRMVTPAKGDVASVPLNAAGREVANAWDPAKDEAAGLQCKAYGAPGLMRIPGRIHITWQDENTLKVETDAGTQTRLLHFNSAAPQNVEASWQGFSAAIWEIPGAGRGGRGGAPPGPPVAGGLAQAAAGASTPAAGRAPRPPTGGSLKVVTTHLKPGYLRKNGVPYSDRTVLTEYYSRTMEPNGDSWLIITTAVEDPQYLNGTFLTSTHFKRQADRAGWAPSSCTAR